MIQQLQGVSNLSVHPGIILEITTDRDGARVTTGHDVRKQKADPFLQCVCIGVLTTILFALILWSMIR